MEQKKVLWLTIERHPESLKALIRHKLAATSWEVFEIRYEDMDSVDKLPLETISGVLLAPAREIPLRILSRLETCSLLQIWSSGFDKFNLGDAQKFGIPVANNHGSNAVSVAEHTLLLMLGVSRRAPEMHSRVVQGKWAGNDHGMGSYSLSGKTLGIIGMGRIGTLVAVRALAFGMKVVYTDPNVSQSESPAGSRRVEWGELLRMSDYISLHLHHTKDTRNLLNADAFASMEKRPFIINASRAELIDRKALIGAMHKGEIRGLGIDAHYKEPTSEQDELWQFSQVFTTPHVAGSTVDSYMETVDACITNLAVAFEGRPPQGLIP